MSGPEKLFVLGVGAQKGGTAWLHGYLAASPGTDMGALKEYHVWDVLTLPGANPYDMRGARGAKRAATAFLARLAGGGMPAGALRRRLQRDPEAYFDYFAERLAAPGIRITGDITPAYAGLSAETLARIRDGFAARGIGMRAVFLMRDPVERILSAARMARRRELKIAGRRAPPSDAAALEAAFATPGARMRTRYDLTCAALDATLPAGCIHYGLFETLFTPAGIAGLAAFLDLPARAEAGGEKVNANSRYEPVPEALLARVRAEYADVYSYCARRFPQTRELWRS